MPMSPALRKFALTTHVVTSVGWLGAVAAFLVLALAGLRSADPGIVRAAYVGMELVGWWLIVPLCFASLFSGLVQSLGTEWGLFRHYWVLFKLLINVLSTALLVLHMGPIERMAAFASAADLVPGAHEPLRVQLVFDAGAALVALVVATVLSVYKPRGVTPFGRANGRLG